MYTLSIKGKIISIFPSLEVNVPVIYLNTFSNEGQKVFEAAQAAGCPPFTLVAISDLDWNHDMVPWDSPPAFKSAGRTACISPWVTRRAKPKTRFCEMFDRTQRRFTPSIEARELTQRSS